MESYSAIVLDTECLSHYGMPRRSGRYPWGSGKDPFQHRGDFMTRVTGLRKEGYSDDEIANIMGYENPKELHYQLRLAKEENLRANITAIEEMKARGETYASIAKELGLSNESTVRSMINQKDDRLNKAAIKGTIELLKKTIDEHGMLDVGDGAEYHLGISKDTLYTAIYALTGEGYQFYNSSMRNVTNQDKKFVLSVLAAPDKEYRDAYDYENIYHLYNSDEHSEDGGKTFKKLEYPASMDSKRLQVVFDEEGGSERDGLIEIRPGVKDLSLGDSTYAQVRILVDDSKYLKGMAVYNDDLPEGIDVRFNSNKSQEKGKLGALKDIKEDDPNNPFGSALKLDGGQNHYIGDDGKEHLGLVNKTREEGEWANYRQGLSNQFLSKQSPALIKQQLDKSVGEYVDEYNKIQSLTNNALRKYYLEEFAGTCDKTSASLQATSIKGQAWKVILPDPNVKENEIYDPNYPNGTKLALVRYPHGAIFEIPVVTVNNKIASAKKMIGNGVDAVALNKRTADILSGADFDGDTVLTIPYGSGDTKILTAKRPEGLKDYDPKNIYTLPFASDKAYRKKLEQYYTMNTKEHKNQTQIAEELGMTKEQVKQLAADSKKVMRNTQTEMGKISNLIVDMTVKGAPMDEIEKAVKHSMTVIDAEKHCLDYKKSYEDNNIKAIKKKWQLREEYNPETGEYKTTTGAATILTRAHADTQVTKRVGSPHIDPETGDLIWKQEVQTYTDPKTGKIKERTTTVKGIDTVRDANALYGGGGTKEKLYVDYSNTMKDMARQARLEYLKVPNVKKDPDAAKMYESEVNSLNAKYEAAKRNQPRERQAQMIANAQVIQAKRDAKKAGVKLDSDTIGKLANRTLAEGREEAGARGKQTKIKISPKEWEAIQAGAISTSRFTQLLKYCDKDVLRSYAMPKKESSLTPSEIAKIRAMLNSPTKSYSLADIAQAVGVSTSTVAKYK